MSKDLKYFDIESIDMKKFNIEEIYSYKKILKERKKISLHDILFEIFSITYNEEKSKKLANDITFYYPTITNLCDASYINLIDTGLTERYACLFKSIANLSHIFFDKPPVNDYLNFKNLLTYIKYNYIKNLEFEQGIVVHLNENYEFIDKQCFKDKSHNQVSLIMSDIINKSFVNKTKYLIILHNHPKPYNCTPSNADLVSAKTMVESFKLSKIKILDFIIFNDREIYSFQCHGLMKFINEYVTKQKNKLKYLIRNEQKTNPDLPIFDVKNQPCKVVCENIEMLDDEVFLDELLKNNKKDDLNIETSKFDNIVKINELYENIYKNNKIKREKRQLKNKYIDLKQFENLDANNNKFNNSINQKNQDLKYNFNKSFEYQTYTLNGALTQKWIRNISEHGDYWQNVNNLPENNYDKVFKEFMKNTTKNPIETDKDCYEKSNETFENEIEFQLKNILQPKGKFHVIKKNGKTVIDEYYNNELEYWYKSLSEEIYIDCISSTSGIINKNTEYKKLYVNQLNNFVFEIQTYDKYKNIEQFNSKILDSKIDEIYNKYIEDLNNDNDEIDEIETQILNELAYKNSHSQRHKIELLKQSFEEYSKNHVDKIKFDNVNIQIEVIRDRIIFYEKIKNIVQVISNLKINKTNEKDNNCYDCSNLFDIFNNEFAEDSSLIKPFINKDILNIENKFIGFQALKHNEMLEKYNDSLENNIFENILNTDKNIKQKVDDANQTKVTKLLNDVEKIDDMHYLLNKFLDISNKKTIKKSTKKF